MAMRFLSKEEMIQRLDDVKNSGWIRSLRPLNSGGIGNTIDKLLGFPENNLPVADTAQWELKSHRQGSSSLLTLFHMEPEPREQKVVASILLPRYGWPDQKRQEELSFRQTLRATGRTDRGFGVSVNRLGERIEVTFDSSHVADHHQQWLESVKARAGLGPLVPEVYWDFQELFRKASTKMLNSFYVEAEAKREDGDEYFKIARVLILEGFDIERFVLAIESGNALIDFDARTRHNHGTKFRLRQDTVPNLYRYSEQVL